METPISLKVNLFCFCRKLKYFNCSCSPCLKQQLSASIVTKIIIFQHLSAMPFVVTCRIRNT